MLERLAGNQAAVAVDTVPGADEHCKDLEVVPVPDTREEEGSELLSDFPSSWVV